LAFGVEQIKFIFKSPTVETVGYGLISQTIEIIKMRDENMEVAYIKRDVYTGIPKLPTF